MGRMEAAGETDKLVVGNPALPAATGRGTATLASLRSLKEAGRGLTQPCTSFQAPTLLTAHDRHPGMALPIIIRSR